MAFYLGPFLLGRFFTRDLICQPGGFITHCLQLDSNFTLSQRLTIFTHLKLVWRYHYGCTVCSVPAFMDMMLITDHFHMWQNMGASLSRIELSFSFTCSDKVA